MSAPKTVAVLGGGIAGLTAAFSLSRILPRESYRIVLAESQSRLGGWMGSERVPVFDDGGPAALLERGPRSIRPVGYRGRRMIELVRAIS